MPLNDRGNMDTNQVATLKAYMSQLENTVRSNSQTLDQQIALKNELITRRAQKETQEDQHKEKQA